MNEIVDMHGVVELSDHRLLAGRISEQTIGGTPFIRVDVPTTSKRASFAAFYGLGAIYSLTPLDEGICQRTAEVLNRAPVDVLQEDPVLAPPLAIIPESEDEPFFLEDEMPNTLVDKRAAAQWARELLAGEFVIVDTETTGFEVTDEVIQIGVIDHTGAVVLDTLIRPTQPIRNSQYHHITDDTVKDAPTFPDAYVRIKAAVEGKRILAYNTSYDTRMLNQVCAKHGLELFIWVQPGCVMEQYAEFHGEWNDYHGNYRWQKLRQAVTQMGLEFEGSEHNAVADCRATLALLRAMAAFEAVPMG